MSTASTQFFYEANGRTYEVTGTCTFVGPYSEIDEPDEWSVTDEDGKEVSDEALGDLYELIRGAVVDRCFDLVKRNRDANDENDGDYDDGESGGIDFLRIVKHQSWR